MAICKLEGVRTLGMADLFAAKREPKREQLCEYRDVDDGSIVIQSNAITLVLNRDIRKSVEISNGMALFLARKFPQRDVLLINTYAGADLMQRTFAHAAHEQGIPLPPSFAPYFDKPGMTFDPAAPNPFPENLSILDAPTSLLTATRLEEEVKSRRDAIVLLNSFEFTTFSRWEREQFATGVLGIRERMPLTMVIFSHEQRYDVSSYTPARGPIGVLSAYASSVWRLMSHSERLRWEKRYAVYSLKSQQMHRPNDLFHESQTQLEERTPTEERTMQAHALAKDRAEAEAEARDRARVIAEDDEDKAQLKLLRREKFQEFSGKTEYANGHNPRKKAEAGEG